MIIRDWLTNQDINVFVEGTSPMSAIWQRRMKDITDVKDHCPAESLESSGHEITLIYLGNLRVLSHPSASVRKALFLSKLVVFASFCQ